jgi:hypothetical protein
MILHVGDNRENWDILICHQQLHRGMASANHGRDVVALGDMEHKTSKLFEPQASFWTSRNEPWRHSRGHSGEGIPRCNCNPFICLLYHFMKIIIF